MEQLWKAVMWSVVYRTEFWRKGPTTIYYYYYYYHHLLLFFELWALSSCPQPINAMSEGLTGVLSGDESTFALQVL